MLRIRRRILDRLPGFVRRTRRFRCSNRACSSEALSFYDVNPRLKRVLRWSFYMLAAWALLQSTVALVEYMMATEVFV